MSDETTDYAKYLDPRVLAKIAALDLRARLVVQGYVSGRHRSPYRGFSVEFAEHREYSQGDDLKHLDWKVFGRTDKYYIKQYEEETNLNCVMLLDCSESMAYRSDDAGMTKHEYATAIAASLAYLALQQQDSVGLAAFDRQITRFLHPSNNPGHWKTLIHEMQAAVGPGKTGLRSVMDDLAERLPRRTLVVVLSDLFDDPDEIVRGLKHLRYRRHEVIVFQIMDHAELEFPFRAATLFEGLEGTGELMVEPRALRKRYLDELRRFTDTLRAQCRNMHMDYEVVDTSHPLDDVLTTYLATRNATVH
ncbi:MAG: DUF58 domain-containing protein [Phycisphaerae bacterium]|nr:DUF58 domain-containing protein [Phycisphaerae bacterium]